MKILKNHISLGLVFSFLVFFVVKSNKHSPEHLGTLLSFGRICALESGMKCPYIHVFYPVRSQCVEIECFPDLENLSPVEELTFDLISRSCQKRTYPNAKTSKNQRDYGKNLLIDEYLEKIPFLWKLKCPHELKKVISYFKKRVTALQVAPTGDVPLLISLDYGVENTDHLRKNECPFFDSQDVEITEEEGTFIKQYFKILSHGEAHLIFSLYHKMMVQVDSMKSSTSYWSSTGNVFKKFCGFIKGTLNDLGIAEVFYRLFLIQAILFLESHSGLNLGKKIRSWIVRGAKRGTPSLDGESSGDDKGSNLHNSPGDGLLDDDYSPHSTRDDRPLSQDRSSEPEELLSRGMRRNFVRKSATPQNHSHGSSIERRVGLSKTATSFGIARNQLQENSFQGNRGLRSSKTHSVFTRKSKGSFESSRPKKRRSNFAPKSSFERHNLKERTHDFEAVESISYQSSDESS